MFIPTLIGVSLLIFFILRVLPGDRALDLLLTAEGEGNVTRTNLETTRVALGEAKEVRRPAEVTIEIVPQRPATEIASVLLVPDQFTVSQDRLFRFRETFQFRAIALDAEGYAIPNANVEWESLDPNAGTITRDGLYTPGNGVGVHSESIVAKVTQQLPDGRTLERTVSPVVEIVDKMFSQGLSTARVFPEKLRLAPGESFQFVAAGYDGDGDYFNEPRFTWSVLSGSGSIDQGGRFRAGGTPGEVRVQSEVIKTRSTPLYEQYWDWITGMVKGDPGRSYQTGRPIFNDLFGGDLETFIKKSKFIVSIEIGLISFFMSIVIGIPLGIIMAMRQDTWLDYVTRVVGIFGLAMPTFWVGILIILFLVLYFDWLPPLGYKGFFEDPLENIKQLIWPMIAIAISSGAALSRLTRSQMLEVLRQDYIRTAWAKGLRERVILARHALKNAMLPIVTVLGVRIAFIVTGSVILESLFNLPGMGLRLIQAANAQDFNVVQFIGMMVATLILFSNLLVDILYAWLDPRVRYT
jgi:peptide/nickel transport system permease protein